MNAMQSGLTSGSVILMRSLTDGEVVNADTLCQELHDLQPGRPATNDNVRTGLFPKALQCSCLSLVGQPECTVHRVPRETADVWLLPRRDVSPPCSYRCVQRICCVGSTFVPVRNVLGDSITKDPVSVQSVLSPALD